MNTPGSRGCRPGLLPAAPSGRPPVAAARPRSALLAVLLPLEGVDLLVLVLDLQGVVGQLLDGGRLLHLLVAELELDRQLLLLDLVGPLELQLLPVGLDDG